jgi:hypothetical protein
MKQKLLLVVLLFVINVKSYGQQNETKDKGFYSWVSLGIPLTSIEADNRSNLLSARAAIDFSIHQKYFITLLYDVHDRFCILCDYKPNTVENFENKSILFGIGKYYKKYFALIGSVGISSGKGLYIGNANGTAGGGGFFSFKYTTYEHEYYQYIGLPIHLKALLTGPFVGFSVELYCNLHEHTDFGLVLSLNLGRIHKRSQTNRF